ncbi:MAG: ABC transporter ATP-binding protein/permease [Inhella sp.]
MERPAAPGFNSQLARQFLRIAQPYWRDAEERWRAFGLLALLMLLLLGQTGFNVLFNQETGEFTSALAARDGARFWSSIERFVWILLAAVPIYALYYFVRDTLGLRWRRWLTVRFLGRYFEGRAYYHLNADGTLDNPDQRIAEDINSFTSQSLYFSMIVLGALVQMAAFASVLWGISPLLIYILCIYALISTFFTARVFGRHLVPLNFAQLQREADFRFGLVRLREHAEPVALHGGEAHERGTLQRLFDAAYANYRRVLRWQLKLNLFQYAHSFLTLVLPSMVIARDVLEGRLEVGHAVQAAGAFGAILSALTLIVEHFEGLSRFSAGIARLHAFQQQLERPHAVDGIRSEAAHELALQDLCVYTPGRAQCLLQGLSLHVPPGQGLLISGASGTGKSSLLRVLAGLWDEGSGCVQRPAAPDMLFLPQQPYLPLGPLREQLLYPHPERAVSDAELQHWLERVNLADLATRFGGLDAERDWGKLLSIGEQQRLAFVRALLARPRYLLLDEATSALDADNERRLYELLAPLSITPISVSHHPALRAFHRQELCLSGGGGWTLDAL